MSLAGAFTEGAMCRILLAFSAALSLAAPGKASAQAGCQPTITQPCAKVSDKADNQAPKTKGSARSEDASDSKDHSPRIQLDKDTEFKFGAGGIGVGRKF